MAIKLLLHNREAGSEVRPLYFYKAFNKEVPQGRIISFGSCNFNCPYCKRRSALRSFDGTIIAAVEVTLENIFKICDDAIAKNQIIRLSGGDPVAFPSVSLKVAEYIKAKEGRLSLAHNGSSPAFVARIAPFLESAAIDLKAVPKFMPTVSGLPVDVAQKMYNTSLRSQEILISLGILTDIRTPIFHFTTLDDLLFMASTISQIADLNNKFWTLRIYKEVIGCDFKSPNKENVVWMANEIKKVFPHLKIGIRCCWIPAKFLFVGEEVKDG